jgi:membrane protease YdiL (CAAX protease family)
MYALIEEVTYRGIIQMALIDKIGVFKGLPLTSILFALSHIQYYSAPLGLLPFFLGSILLGYLYLRKRNLSSPVIYHFLHNFILWSFNY